MYNPASFDAFMANMNKQPVVSGSDVTPTATAPGTSHGAKHANKLKAVNAEIQTIAANKGIKVAKFAKLGEARVFLQQLNAPRASQAPQVNPVVQPTNPNVAPAAVQYDFSKVGTITEWKDNSENVHHMIDCGMSYRKKLTAYDADLLLRTFPDVAGTTLGKVLVKFIGMYPGETKAARDAAKASDIVRI
jgi:hypothetical protein